MYSVILSKFIAKLTTKVKMRQIKDLRAMCSMRRFCRLITVLDMRICKYKRRTNMPLRNRFASESPTKLKIMTPLPLHYGVDVCHCQWISCLTKQIRAIRAQPTIIPLNPAGATSLDLLIHNIVHHVLECQFVWPISKPYCYKGNANCLDPKWVSIGFENNKAHEHDHVK